MTATSQILMSLDAQLTCHGCPVRLFDYCQSKLTTDEEVPITTASSAQDQSNSQRIRKVAAADFNSLDYEIYEATNSYSRSLTWNVRLSWLQLALEHHLTSNVTYARLASAQRFDPDSISSEQDLKNVPVLTSGMFKKGVAASQHSGILHECSSSGTRGTKSLVLRDSSTLERYLGTVTHGLKEFHPDSELSEVFVLSPRMSSMTTGGTWFAYVLNLVQLSYPTAYYVRDNRLHAHQLFTDLTETKDRTAPIIVAPPSLFYDWLRWLKRHHLRLNLRAKGAHIILTGGWKTRQGEAVSRQDLETMAQYATNLQPEWVRDAYNMVELNTVIFECEYHTKHVPPWLSIIARDPATMKVSNKEKDGTHFGMLSFLDPTPSSFPGFILSDDVGRVWHENQCPCGRIGQALEIQRRLQRIEDRGCALHLERYGEDIGEK
jgi:long-chain-fatty-acid---luciferin-component ligase